MRASIRGSMRSVMVTESASSPAPATEVSIRRTSMRVSAQKAASASSRSKRGTSSQFDKRFMGSLSEGLVELSLIKETFLGLEVARENDASLAAVGAIDGKNARAISGGAKIKKPCLDGKS